MQSWQREVLLLNSAGGRHGGLLPDNDINCFRRNPQLLSPVAGQPESGCAFWTREPDADDELLPP